jgi:transposase
MEVLSKGMIERWILPHLSKGLRGPQSRVATVDIVRAIFYRLKSGCQWRLLPVEVFFKQGQLSWSGIYHHHSRWVKDGSWRRVWIALLKTNKRHLNLSSMQLDGSQSLAKKQGENIGYQGRRKAKTTNALFLCDSSGQPLAIATPQGGNHNDLYEIEVLFSQMCDLISEAGIPLDGVFMNADAGFDAAGLRQQCSQRNIEANINPNPRNSPGQDHYIYFDEDLYKQRFVIERTNAWIDSFKALLVRYEGMIATWIQQHFMAFTILMLRKINKC